MTSRPGQEALPLYPFAGKTLDRNGLALHYLDEGQGDPILFLHGNPTWSFAFRRYILAARETARAIAPDHIGCGLSAKPPDDLYTYRLASRVDDIEALLSHLGIRRNLTLVLHDWGGMIGMAYAARHPESIGRLVLFNTAAFPLPKSKAFPMELAVCRTPLLGALLVRGLNAFCRGALRTGCARGPLSREVRRAYLAPYDSWSARRAVHRFVEDIPLRPGHPSYELVKSVEAALSRFQGLPIAIFWGLRDFVFDRHFLDAWLGHFPGAAVETFEDAGHLVFEDAAEEILPKFRAFLAANPLRG